MKTFYNFKTTITDHRSVLQKSHQLHDLSHNTVNLHSLQYRRYIGLVLLLSQGQRLHNPINHHKGYFIHELRCDITILVPFPGVLLCMRTPSSTYQAAHAHWPTTVDGTRVTAHEVDSILNRLEKDGARSLQQEAS
jgi:hypothetical protein